MARQFVGAPADDNRFFRFSVTQGAGSIALEEWEHVDELTAHTHAYLKEAEVSHAVNCLVSLLCAPGRAAEGGAAATLNHVCKPSATRQTNSFTFYHFASGAPDCPAYLDALATYVLTSNT
jgi:hypothetical protein